VMHWAVGAASTVFTQIPPPRQTGGAAKVHTQGKPGMSVQERDPCPHRIFDDIGGAFAMGAIGGGVWNSVKGARNSPRGERLLGSVTAVKARAPVMGGAPRPLRSRHALRLLRSRAYPNQTREPA
jgi:hypothetical protein